MNTIMTFKNGSSLKRLLFLFTLFFAFGFTAKRIDLVEPSKQAGTATLSAGDVAIIGLSGRDEDEFSWAPFVDLEAGEVVYFTSASYFNGEFKKSGSFLLKYTTPAEGLRAGTVMTVFDDCKISGEDCDREGDYTIVKNTMFGSRSDATVRTSGDRIFIFQSTDVEDGDFGKTHLVPIFAVTAHDDEWKTISELKGTHLFPGLTDGVNAVAVGSSSFTSPARTNVRYRGTAIGSRDVWLANVANAANWEDNSNTVYSTWTRHGVFQNFIDPDNPVADNKEDSPSAPTVTSTPITNILETEFYQYLLDAVDAEGEAFEFIGREIPDWLNFGPGDEPQVSTFLTRKQLEGSKTNPDSREPKLIAADKHGNIYMADVGHHVIRKISPDQKVITFAGSGDNKYENGKGIEASFVDMQGIAVGPDGYIYVSEAGKGDDGKISHRIRKISPEAEVTNFVGREFTGDMDFHIGTSATFDTPMGLAFDSKGNLYVADSKNHNLRKVTPDGVVTTFAGIGEDPPLTRESGIVDGFASIEYLAVDSKDNIYVTSRAENRVLKVNQEGIIEIFSGAAGKGDTEDIDGTEQFIKYDEPLGIAIDRDDNVFITDMNMKVKRIGPGGKTVRHIAGNGDWEVKDGVGKEAAFQTPFSLAFDASGNLLVAESRGHNLRRLSGAALTGDPLGQVGVHDVSIEVKDAQGNSRYHDFQITVEDATPPVVLNILRQDPEEEQLTGSEATFRVVFDDEVINVDQTDFSIKADGAEGAINSVTAVDTKTYDVKITGVKFKLLLDLELNSSSDIENIAGLKIEEFHISETEETYIGPNSAPAFSTDPVTDAENDEKYKYQIGVSDLDKERVGVFGVTIPDWLELEVSFGNTEVSGLPTKLFGVGIASDGTVYTGSVNNDFAGVKKVLSDGTSEDFVGSVPGFEIGTGAAAQFEGVDDIVVDKDGNLFIADAENRSIRKVDTSGSVTTLIGDGPGNGPPTLKDGSLAEANIKQAYGLVLNDEGDLFFTDAGFYKVRKISADGQVTTLVGNSSGFSDGLGNEVRFGHLRGITMDSQGNLYVVDQGNHSIRKIAPDGAVTTLAGNGSKGATNGKGENARFNSPTGITIDKGGNLYVTDTGNGKIRKVTLDGIVTDFELSGINLDAPERIAMTPNGVFYITDSGLQKLAPSSFTLTGTPSNLAGGISVELVAVDGSGASTTQSFTILIPDGDPPVFTSDKTEIVEENITGIVHTVVAEDLATLTYALGTTKDESLFSIDQNTGEVSFLEAPDFEKPTDANANNVYEIEVIADDATFQVSQVVLIKVGNLNDPPGFTSTPITEIKESQLYNYEPTAQDDDNSVLIYSSITLPNWLSFEKKLDTEVATHAGSGVAGKNNAGLENASFDHPYDLEFDVNGDLIVVDRENHMIRKIGTTSASTLAGNGIAGLKNDNGIQAQFNEPSGITVSSNGTIYIADAGNHVIRSISTSGDVKTYSGTGESGYEEGARQLSKYNEPAGLAFWGSDLYVADKQNHVIRKVTTSGSSTYAGTGTAGFMDGESGSALFNLPTDIEFDSKGNLYVVDSGNKRIRKISTSGQVTTVVGSDLIGHTDGTEGVLDSPLGITIDDDDNLFFTESDTHIVRRLSSDGVLSAWAGKGGSGVTDGESDVATFNTPRGLAVDDSGVLFVADELNHKIRKITSSEGDYQLIGDPIGQIGEHMVKLTASDGRITTEQEFIIKVIDGVLPKLVSVKRHSPTTEKLTNGIATFQVIFNEDMDDIEANDFILKNENSGQVTSVEKISSTTFNVIIGGIGDNTIVELDFHPDHDISDISGNTLNRLLEATNGPNESFIGPDPLTIVSILRHDPTDQQLVGDQDEVVFKVKFSEEVQGIALSDFEVKAGGASGTVTAINQPSPPIEFEITVSNVAGGKPLDLDIIATNGIKDNDGNALSSTDPDDEQTYIGVNIAPEITSTNVINVYRGETIDYDVKISDLEDDNFELTIENIPDWLTSEAQFEYLVTTLSQISDPTDEQGRTKTHDDPIGLTLDSQDNLYVIDQEDETIKKITPEGEVSTYVSYKTIEDIDPQFLEFDLDGNLIIAGWDVIYKLNDQSEFELLAGANNSSSFADGTKGEARFDNIFGMVLAEDGNLYLSDQNNRRIRKVTPEGVVTTLAGSGPTSVGQGTFGPYFEDGDAETAKFSSPRDIISDHNGNLLVADHYNDRIRKVDMATGQVSTFAGGGTSGTLPGNVLEVSFIQPTNLAGNSEGNVYVRRSGYSGMRRIDPEGNVTLVTGSEANGANASGYPQFSQLVANSKGELLGNYRKEHSIHKVNPNGTGYKLTGIAPDEAGEYKYTIKVTDEHGAVKEAELVINVLSKNPVLLKIERHQFYEEVIAQDQSEALFRLTFDRDISMTKGANNFELVSETASATLSEAFFIQLLKDEMTVKLSGFSGYGKIGLKIRDGNDIKSVQHNAPIEGTVPTETNETFILELAVPEMKYLTSIGSSGWGGQQVSGDFFYTKRTFAIRGEEGQPGVTVQAFLDDVFFGEDEVGDDGRWEVNYSGPDLDDGTYELKVKAVYADLSLESEFSQMENLKVDATPPDAPVITGISEDSGLSTTDFITNDDQITFSGTAEANARIQLINGSDIETIAMANANGEWTYDHSDVLTEGIHTFTFRALDKAGWASPQNTEVGVVIDTTNPDTPVVNSITDDNGVSASDKLTNDNMPEFTGSADPNGIVEILLNGNSLASNVPVGSDGIWTYIYNGIPLVDGMHNILAIATDEAGNTSVEGNAFTFEINATINDPTLSPLDDEIDILPASNLVMTFTEDIHKGTGNIIIKQSSDNSILETIDVTSANVTINGGEVTIDPTNNLLPTGEEFYVQIEAGALTDDAGNSHGGITNTTDWSFTIINAPTITSVTGPSAGIYGIGDVLNFTVTFTLDVVIAAPINFPIDIGGTTVFGSYTGDGSKSNTATFAYTILEDEIDSDGISLGTELILASGSSEINYADNTSTAAQLAFSGIADLSGVIVDGVKPTVTLTTDAAASFNSAFTVTVTYDETVSNFALSDISVTNGTPSNFAPVTAGQVWTATITPDSDGTVIVSVPANVAQDAGGNDNNASNAINITFDATPPDPPVVSGISDDTGSDNSDELTNDQTLSFTGTAEANSTVEVFIGGSSIGTTTADGSGDWTFDHSNNSLSDDTYTVTAKTTDLAGNTSDEGLALSVTVDTSIIAPGLFPENGEIGVIPNDNLLMTFGENMNKGSGNITIKRSSDNSTFETIDVTSNNVNISGGIVTIDPTNIMLPALSEFYVLIDDGALKDDAGNNYAGINSTSEWSFRVKDAPLVTLVTSTDGTYGIGDVLEFNVKFDIDVNTSGDITFPIALSGVPQTASLISQVTSDEMVVFGYTIQEGDLDDNGVGIGTTLSLVGSASLKDDFDTDAILLLNVIDNMSRVLVDGVKPSVTLTTSVDAIVNDAFSVTFSYDETVTNFSLSDISVTNGVASDFTVITPGLVWSATITPDAAGNVDVSLGADVAEDQGGNGNNASNNVTRQFNTVPSDLLLSSNSIAENNSLDDVVGILSTTDPDVGDTHTYTFVSGLGDTDNGTFVILGNELRAGAVFDREIKDQYSIRVKVDDGINGTFEKEFTITIDNVLEPDLRITGDQQIPGTALNFTSDFEITIHNDGDGDLQVNDIVYPDPVFSGPATPITVSPAGSETVTMHFTPTVAQTYSGSIIIDTNDGQGILDVSADGTIITGTDDDSLMAKKINIFPNPVSSLLTVDLESYAGRSLSISLFDLGGIQRFRQLDYQELQLVIDVSTYPSGLYLLLVGDGKEVVQKKIMIRR